MVRLLGRAIFALSMLALVLPDDLDEFEAMMAEPVERGGWIDPMDMGLSSSGGVQGCDLGAVSKELQVCKEALKRALEKNLTNSPKPVQVTSATDVFLKRHVSSLVQRLGLVSGRPAHYSVEIQLSSLDTSLLYNYIDVKPASGGHAVDVVDVLGRMVKGVENYEKSPVLETMKEHLASWKDPMITLSTACLLVLLITSLARTLPPRKLAVVVLLLCCAWHWTHLYKKMWAAKHSTLLQSGNVPLECRPEEMTWLQTIQSSARSVFSSVDRCEEYHKAIMVDPVYEVNPLTAVVDLVTTLVLHPLSSLGSEVGLMFSGLLSNVPLFWKVPVLLLFVLLLMFILVLVAGYRIRLPFFLGDISPAAPQSAAPTQSLAAEIQQLKSLLAEPAVRRASQPALQRQGSTVEEVDMVDYQLVEEEEEEMMLRRRCLSLTQLETRGVLTAGSLPGSPVGTPIKGRLIGTPRGTPRNSPRGTPKKMTTPARRAILTPMRSNPNLLAFSKRTDGQEESSLEEQGRNITPLSQTKIPSISKLVSDTNHDEEALDLRLEVNEDSPDLETVEPLPGLQEGESPRKALVVVGDPQSPVTTSFGWVGNNSKSGCSTLENEPEEIDDELALEVTENEMVTVMVVNQTSRSGDFLEKVEEVFHRNTDGSISDDL